MAIISGTAYFYVDGTQYALRGDMNISIGKTKKESVIGQDGYHGVKEMPDISFIECTLTHKGDIDLNMVEDLNNVTVKVELRNGASAMLNNATQVEKISLNAEDGKYKVRFEAAEGQWLTQSTTQATTQQQA